MSTSHPPQQARSRETLARIKAAAEELMAQQSFEKITVQQIVKKAKTTTGSFYARFEDKDALFDTLHTEHVEETVRTMKSRLQELPEAALPERVSVIVQMIGFAFHRRPGLMRSGTLAFWTNPNRGKQDQLAEEAHREFGKQIRRIGQELVKVAAGLGHPEPKEAGFFALKIALSASRHHYLFSDERTVLKISSKKFERQLTKMVLTYLSHGE